MRTFKDFIINEAKTTKDTYISLKNEINNLWDKFNSLYSMPSVSEMKEQIWKEGYGDVCINDLGWLSTLQKNIAEIINQKPPVDMFFISLFDSIDKKYNEIKKYYSKMGSFC